MPSGRHGAIEMTMSTSRDPVVLGYEQRNVSVTREEALRRTDLTIDLHCLIPGRNSASAGRVIDGCLLSECTGEESSKSKQSHVKSAHVDD